MISESFDKIGILYLQLLLKDNHQQMQYIKKNLNFEKKKLFDFFKKNKFDFRYVFYINLLSIINYKIWSSREKLYNKKGNFNPKILKFGHQINSIRNIIKNRIDQIKNKNKITKTNTLIEKDLKLWNLFLIKGKPSKSHLQKYPMSNIAEYLDELTIKQLKEINFNTKRKFKDDLKIHFENYTQFKNVNNPSYIIFMVPMLSLINSIVWDIKDTMIMRDQDYNEFIQLAQNLNSMRNDIINMINKKEHFDRQKKSGIFYDEAFKKKLLIIEKCLNIKFNYQNSKFNYLKVNDLEQLFLNKNEKFHPEAISLYKKENFLYKNCFNNREKIIKNIISKIYNNKFWVSGAKKIKIWQKGWNENLDLFIKSKNKEKLIPKFLYKDNPLRYYNNWIKPLNKSFEFDLIEIYRTHIFKTFFNKVDSIYEFGCGSAQHLIRLKSCFKDKKITGLDWAQSSIKIIKNLNKHYEFNLRYKIFNMFKPDKNYKLDKNSAILTIGAMEQLGTDYEKFFNYLYKNKPKLVVHMETIREFYNEHNLFDLLAIIYDKKRNYLDGYYSFLKKKQEERKIKIIKSKKINFGSMMHDSYSLIIWKPL